MVKQGYKQTEIGVIPEDWEVRLLYEISDIIDPHPSHRAPIEDKNGIPFYGIGDLDKNGNVIKKDFRTVPSKIFEEHNLRYNLDESLIALGRVASIGKVIKLKKVSEIGIYTLSPTLGIIRSNSKSNNDYLNFILSSDFVKNYFIKIMSGSTRSSVGMIVLRKIPIPLPPLAEQEAIASALSDAEAWIDSLEQLIAKKRLIKQGAMQELLTPPSTSSGNADGEALEPWEVKKLGEVFNIIKGQQFNSVLLEDDGDYPCYSGGISPSGYSEKYNETENTIIISEGGNSCGYVNFVKTKFWLGGHCYKVVFRTSKLEKQFTYHLLKFNQDKIMSLRVGSGLPNIQKKSIEDFEISFPSLSEQTRIATILSDMDAELEALEQQLDKARQIKQGMMQELLTGRVRLV